jgi:hypothetical protein
MNKSETELQTFFMAALLGVFGPTEKDVEGNTSLTSIGGETTRAILARNDNKVSAYCNIRLDVSWRNIILLLPFVDLFQVSYD